MYDPCLCLRRDSLATVLTIDCGETRRDDDHLGGVAATQGREMMTQMGLQGKWRKIVKFLA